MTGQNLNLYVASYQEPDIAKLDYESLEGSLGEDFVICGAVVVSRGSDGKVKVTEHADGHAAGGAVVGGGIGFVVGLFAPGLLAATAVGAGIGALMGHLNKKAEEGLIGVSLEDYLPRNYSAVVVIVDDLYLDRVEAALGKSVKSVKKAIDSGDAEKLEKALEKAGGKIDDAIDY